MAQLAFVVGAPSVELALNVDRSAERLVVLLLYSDLVEAGRVLHCHRVGEVAKLSCTPDRESSFLGDGSIQ